MLCVVSMSITSTWSLYFHDVDESEERRVVRSAKDRAIEEVINTGVQIKNHANIKDYNGLVDDFDRLYKAYDKYLRAPEATTPLKPYIRILMFLEDTFAVCTTNDEVITGCKWSWAEEAKQDEFQVIQCVAPQDKEAQ